jgi:hypothetical protein
LPRRSTDREAARGRRQADATSGAKGWGIPRANGLFGAIGATGVMRNFSITNATVTANPNAPPPGQFVGILAGSNGGTIDNDHHRGSP